MSIRGITEAEREYFNGLPKQKTPCTKGLAKTSYYAGYIICLLGIFNYFLSILSSLDGLQKVEEFYRTYNNGTIMMETNLTNAVKPTIDWHFISIIGWLTLLSQMYTLILTFKYLGAQNDYMIKDVPWQSVDEGSATYVQLIDSIFAIVYGLTGTAFFFLCTVYNYKILAKVLESGPHEGVEILRNSTFLPSTAWVDFSNYVLHMH